MAPNPRLLGRSFGWAFILSLGFFAVAVLLFGNAWGIAFAVLSGAVPFVVQALTGYGLDRLWVAKFSRTEYPVKYAMLLTVSFAVAAWFGYVSWQATTSSEMLPPNTSLERTRER